MLHFKELPRILKTIDGFHRLRNTTFPRINPALKSIKQRQILLYRHPVYLPLGRPHPLTVRQPDRTSHHAILKLGLCPDLLGRKQGMIISSTETRRADFSAPIRYRSIKKIFSMRSRMRLSPRERNHNIDRARKSRQVTNHMPHRLNRGS